MPQESLREMMSARVLGRIAGSHEGYPLNGDPLLVRGSPESPLLDHLAKELNDFLGSEGVLIGKVDLIAENYECF